MERSAYEAKIEVDYHLSVATTESSTKATLTPEILAIPRVIIMHTPTVKICRHAENARRVTEDLGRMLSQLHVCSSISRSLQAPRGYVALHR